jgi:hypothetical protein
MKSQTQGKLFRGVRHSTGTTLGQGCTATEKIMTMRFPRGRVMWEESRSVEREKGLLKYATGVGR